MGAIQKIIRGGVALALGALLAVSAAPAVARAATAGAFEVEGGTSGTDYSYSGGVLTINTSTALTISNTNPNTATNDRIVIGNNTDASLTFNGVNISAPTDQSAIHVPNGSSLEITLAANSTNIAIGGNGSTGSAAPAIRLPDGATLTIEGSGTLNVTGGSSTGNPGGTGIGGYLYYAGPSPTAESCGTVIILSGTVTVTGGSNSAGIGGATNHAGAGGDGGTVVILSSLVTVTGGSSAVAIGGGNSSGSSRGNDGQGIRPGTDGNFTVYGNLELPCDVTIPDGATVTIPEDASLTVPQGTTLTNDGTILMQGGTFIKNGTVNGNQPTYPSKVTVGFSQDGKPVTSVPYGSTVTITATMEKAETATNALSADTGRVDFYLGDANDTGMKMGTGTVEFEDGAYTASVDVTIDQDKGFNIAGIFKFTADFGGYAPEGDEGGDSLAPNTGSAELTVVESYTIDYEEETITIAEGYSLYTAATGGNAILTSSGGNNTTSLMSYIQSAARTLYLQAPATGEGEPSNRREITIPARPQVPTVTIAIDYSEEKLTFPPGANISNLEFSTDTADITSWNDVPSGAALSEMGWDGNTPKTYYFRTGATDASFAGSATTTPIVAPARPAKPAEPTTVEVTSDSITIQVVSGQEYRLSSSGDWSTLTGTTGSDGKTVYTYNNLDSGTQYTIATRTPADDNVKNQFASHPASVTVTTKYETDLGGLDVSGQTGFEGHFQYGDVITVTFTPERQADTGTNALAENTATLTYTPDSGGAVTLATATAQADGSFKLTYDTEEKKLPIGEDLTLTVSYGGSGEFNPVEETVTLSLDKAILKNMPTVTGSFVYGGTLTLNYTPQDDETVTYQWWRIIDDSSTERIDGATGETYTLTESEIGGSIYVIVSATDEWHRGAKQSDQYEISKAPGSIEIACESVTYGEAVQPSVTITTNTGADVTYSYAGTGSTSYGPSATAPTNAGTYTVTATVAETATHTSATSEPVAFSITSSYVPSVPSRPSKPSGPTSGSSEGWDEIADIIASTDEGGRVVVDMGGTTELPAEALEELAGRDVTLVLEMDEGIVWEIDGVDVPEDLELRDLDMGVETGTSGIPVDVVNLVTGAADSVQMTLAHDGPFGFELALVVALGEGNGGLVANLYHYDEEAGSLRYETSGAVDADGTARLTLDHASQWLIALDTQGHALTFADAGEGEWYSEAVRWAWLSGVMTGYEGTDSFGAGDDLTRAQMASVIYRVAGSPEAEASGLPADCDASAWYAGCVAWALEAGVFEGYGDGSAFGPDDPLTREQAACVLMRAAAAAGADTSARADLSAYPDADGVSGWAADALSWAVVEGVLSGVELPDGTRELQPSRACTRAEIAALMMNLSSRATE